MFLSNDSYADITPEKLITLKEADAIVREELDAYNEKLFEETGDRNSEHACWQYFAVLPDIKSVGVMGDERTYQRPIIVRAVESSDAMTADWAKLPYEVISKISSRIRVYLRSRGYRLSVGRIDKLECAFIASKHDLYAYIHVSMTIADRDVEEREYRLFSYIKDGYSSRYLFILDSLLQRCEDVRHLNMIDFMKGNEDLHE